jgi:hypothetical protein
MANLPPLEDLHQPPRQATTPKLGDRPAVEKTKTETGFLFYFPPRVFSIKVVALSAAPLSFRSLLVTLFPPLK